MQPINASVERSTVSLTELWTDSRPNSGDPRRYDGLGLRHIAQQVQLNGRSRGGGLHAITAECTADYYHYYYYFFNTPGSKDPRG